MKNIVTTHWKQNLQFESDNPSGHQVLMDSSVENGGSGSGLSPKAIMLSSLAGCTGLDVISALNKMKVTLEDFKIIVTGELTDTPPKYYHKVTVAYYFRGKDLDENKIKKAVNLSVDKYCGVMEMFRRFASVDIAIHYN